MAYPIINILNKKPRIAGISRFPFIERIKGSRDYRYSQLCQEDGQYTTPRLLESGRNLSEYYNKVYCLVDEALEPVARELASECQELVLLSEQEFLVPDGLDPENVRRQASKKAKQAEKNMERMDEIFIHISEQSMLLEAIDTALQHHLQRAENIVLSSASAYWYGVLKAAASEKLPVMPAMKIPDIPGKAVYEKLFSEIQTRVYQAEEVRPVKESELNG